MYNSIQHFCSFGVKKIEEKVIGFICNQEDIGDLVIGLQDSMFELGRNIIKEVLEEMDEFIKNCVEREKNWEVVRSDEKTGLLTSFGAVGYSRTYYKHKKEGKRKYLLDELVGIGPHDRVTADVVINVIDEAIDSSYRKGGERATYIEDVSKQAVMKKIHELEIIEEEIEVKEKRKTEILYIEADEDHVSLQARKGGKRNIQPKMIYVHEGIDKDKSTEKRRALKNRRYFGGVYRETEELWLEVSEYIDKQYDMDVIKTIYISGDGASWIRQGLDWIPGSRFVLDGYHLKKYIIKATAHVDEAYRNSLRDALDWPDKEMAKEIFDKILAKTDSETKRQTVKESKRYILNNWDGIAIKTERGDEIIGCSAEGHVSHLFSDRLSSRPRGWSVRGVEQMSKLRIYKKNGGNVYDLVMRQKKEKEKEKKQEIQDELRKRYRSAARRYYDVWNGDIPIVSKGKVTGAYTALKSTIGRCG
jgi:hypothetical protein